MITYVYDWVRVEGTLNQVSLFWLIRDRDAPQPKAAEYLLPNSAPMLRRSGESCPMDQTFNSKPSPSASQASPSSSDGKQCPQIAVTNIWRKLQRSTRSKLTRRLSQVR